MEDMSRRDAVRLGASLAIGATVVANRALGQAQAADRQPVKPANDPELAGALKNPYMFMFAEQVTFKTSTTAPHSFDLVITSARDPEGGHNDGVHVRPGTMRIFRADTGRDDFTRQGGIYWRCGDVQGKVRFKKPGPLVMVVRDQDGTVRCYSLEMDIRC
jgi:hypothetical protein